MSWHKDKHTGEWILPVTELIEVTVGQYGDDKKWSVDTRCELGGIFDDEAFSVAKKCRDHVERELKKLRDALITELRS